MRRSFLQVDVFTNRAFTGNAAAVVFGAAGLDDSRMQAIASEMNLSETVFVLPASTPEADYRARIFTPRNELPFAGHPTIATVHAVIEQGLVFNGQVPERARQECGIGVVPIAIEKRSDGLFFLMTQAVPEYRPVSLNRQEAGDMLGCRADDLLDLQPEVVSTGVRWLIVPLASLNAVKTLKPDMAKIERKSKTVGALGATVFCLEAERKDYSVHARSFAPGAGVPEDPVCGSGQGSVAAYIAKHSLLRGKTFEYLAEQGMEVSRPGTVTVKATFGEKGWMIQVGGQAVTVMSGEILF